MHCDKCHKKIEEEDTYERILCGGCNRNEQNPKYHCVRCKVLVRWMDTMDTIKKFARHLSFLKYPLLVLLLLAVVALIWHNLLFTRVLFGIAVVLICIIGLIVGGAFAFPGVYFLGKFIGEKVFKLRMPNFDESPVGVWTWLFGVLTLGAPAIIWVIGWLLQLLGKHFVG